MKEEAKRVHHHQTSITRNLVKGISLRRKKRDKNVNNEMSIITYLSIITLNVNRLNAPIQRYRLAE